MKIVELKPVGTSPFSITWSTDGNPADVKEYSIAVFDASGTPISSPFTIKDPNLDLVDLRGQPRGIYILEIIPFGIDDKEGGKIRAEISVNDTGLERLKTVIPPVPSSTTLLVSPPASRGTTAPKAISEAPLETPPPAQTILRVIRVDDIAVANGTPLASVGLPKRVEVLLSDGNIVPVGVTWTDSGTVPYAGSTAGTYSFTGTLVLPASVTNPFSFTANARCIVPPAPHAPAPGASATASQPPTQVSRARPTTVSSKKANYKLLAVITAVVLGLIGAFWFGMQQKLRTNNVLTVNPGQTLNPTSQTNLSELAGESIDVRSSGNLNVSVTNGNGTGININAMVVNNYGRPADPNRVGEQFIPYNGPWVQAHGVPETETNVIPSPKPTNAVVVPPPTPIVVQPIINVTVPQPEQASPVVCVAPPQPVTVVTPPPIVYAPYVRVAQPSPQFYGDVRIATSPYEHRYGGTYWNRYGYPLPLCR